MKTMVNRALCHLPWVLIGVSIAGFMPIPEKLGDFLFGFSVGMLFTLAWIFGWKDR